MTTDAEIDSALDAVIVAARAHLALLRAGDRATEQQVARAYVALNNATVRYDDLLSEAYDEVTPWDVEYLEPEEGADTDVAGAGSGGGRRGRLGSQRRSASASAATSRYRTSPPCSHWVASSGSRTGPHTIRSTRAPR